MRSLSVRDEMPPLAHSTLDLGVPSTRSSGRNDFLEVALVAQRRSNRRPNTPAHMDDSLTSLAARVQVLNDARSQVAGEIRQVIAAAEAMLADLGTTAGRRGRATAAGGRPEAHRTIRRVSEQARVRMAAAARRRWARYRREEAAQA